MPWAGTVDGVGQGVKKAPRVFLTDIPLVRGDQKSLVKEQYHENEAILDRILTEGV